MVSRRRINLSRCSPPCIEPLRHASDLYLRAGNLLPLDQSHPPPPPPLAPPADAFLALLPAHPTSPGLHRRRRRRRVHNPPGALALVEHVVHPPLAFRLHLDAGD